MNRSLVAVTLGGVLVLAAAGASVVVATNGSLLGRGDPDPLPENFGIVAKSDYQAAVASDGVVTDDEMRRAVADTVQCIQDRGLNAQSVLGDPRERVARVIVVSNTTGASPADTVLDCKSEYMSELDQIFAAQEGASSPITVAEGTRIFGECLTAKGFPPPGAAVNPYSVERLGPIQETLEGGRAITECNQVVQDAHRGTAPSR
jgi:hypothetical protein